ncbi:DHH family phosphoesterase [Corynebacterium halotolerans]|uniref:DHH family phosphoesterase n=1 Tax=Corynebacterium halotolerans TaxID=225326 RepID=UPI003CF0C0B7
MTQFSPEVLTRAADLIRAAESVAVVGHVRSDADAVGSVSAMLLSLRRLGKQAVGVVGQPMAFSANLLSIPAAREIELADTLPEVDLVITVDCGSIDRTGLLSREIAEKWEQTLVIDHHASNPGFGIVNLLIPGAESTTTVIRELLRELDVELDRDIAHCLYAGLVTDTGSFRWGRPAMHELAAELMRTGIDSRQIGVDLIDSTSLVDLQMIGRVLAGVETERIGALTAAVLVAERDVIAGHSDAAVESLVDFVRALEGTDAGVVFKEMAPGFWAVSLRSSVINVSRVAVALGGGGHVPAAGYTAQGSIESVRADLTAALARMGVPDPA